MLIGNRPCACGSEKLSSDCCGPICKILNISLDVEPDDSLLTGWLTVYGPPIRDSFIKKASRFLYPISRYYDLIVNKYGALPLLNKDDPQGRMTTTSLKMNIEHYVLGALTALAHGLFIPTGALLRCSIESSLALLDIASNPKSWLSFIDDSYDSRNVVSRIKRYVTKDVILWYGYLTANFVHIGPAHGAPVIPNICFRDNFVIVSSLQDIVRTCATYHMILERIHFNQIDDPMFWRRREDFDYIEHIEDGVVYKWAAALGELVLHEFPLNERKSDYIYLGKTIRLKS